MKKLYLILSFVCMAAIANAQDAEPELSEKQQENVKALEIAFITKELDLNPDEAQKFWPVYNQYSKEINEAHKNNPDVIPREEKILNIRKKYQEQFVKALASPAEWTKGSRGTRWPIRTSHWLDGTRR